MKPSIRLPESPMNTLARRCQSEGYGWALLGEEYRTEEMLREAFGRFGEVASVSIITDRETGRPRGFAFVEMPDSTAANAAISELDGTQIDGRPVNVNEARPREDRR